MQLTTEQQFDVAAFKVQVQQMSPEQARYEQMIIREAEFFRLLGDVWGVR